MKDVPKVGRKFEVKDVAEGYAANMLFPRGLAMIATPQALKKLQAEKAAHDAERKVQDDLLHKNLDVLKDAKVLLTEKANEQGHLFAGVTKDMILEAISKQAHIVLDSESIVLEKPLKTTGDHKIMVHAAGKKAEITITIEAEK